MLAEINHTHCCQKLRRVSRRTESIVITESVELAVGNVVELPSNYCSRRRQTDETVTAFENVRALNRASVGRETVAGDLIEATLMQDTDEVTMVPIQSINLCAARGSRGPKALETAAGKIDPRDALEKCDIKRATVTRERNTVGPGPAIRIRAQVDFQRVDVGRDAVEPSLICVRNEDVAVGGDREIIEQMARAGICRSVAA